MKIFRSFLFLALPLYLVSCATHKPIPNYLQQLNDTTIKKQVQVPELKIEKNDLLFIQVYSASVRPEADLPYNLPASVNSASATAATSGFLVDTKGNIEYPRLGTFHAEGLTKAELAEQITKKLTDMAVLEKPAVVIRFQNLKITILGEVNTQGVMTIPGERVTILEAVGLAGGVTDYGLKNAVKVIRETDGQREVGVVDLSSKDLFESPYYNLKQNDVVLIDPTPRKAKKTDQDVTFQRISFGLTIVTTLALLYNIFK